MIGIRKDVQTSLLNLSVTEGHPPSTAADERSNAGSADTQRCCLHYLNKYFYENRPMNLEIRKEFLAKMKALYPNDESALLLVISEFLKEQRANTMGFMLRADAKWLNSFGPATLSYPEKFYKNSFDSQYLELLIELVQININESKNTNSLAESIGEHSLDFKDYEKAQKTLDKLKTFIN